MVRDAQYNTAPTLVYTFGTIDQLINHILENWETCFVPFRPDPGAGCDVGLETRLDHTQIALGSHVTLSERRVPRRKPH